MDIGWVSGSIEIEGLPDHLFGQPITHEDVDMSEEILQEILGDENARVSVSKNIKDTSYGTGFGTQVTVSLTCGQQDDSLRAAHMLADELTQEFTTDSFAQAEKLFKDHGLHKKNK